MTIFHPVWDETGQFNLIPTYFKSLTGFFNEMNLLFRKQLFDFFGKCFTPKVFCDNRSRFVEQKIGRNRIDSI